MRAADSMQSPNGAIPPKTALEKILVDIWQDVLEIGVSVDDNFFDLGGDSVLAAEVFTRVEDRLGLHLPLRAAAEHATVQDMAEWISSYSHADGLGRTVVRLSRSLADRNFWCVHGMGGHVLVFGGLAQRLEDALSFYAFESVGRNDLRRADRSVDAMAQRYIADMKRVQPSGPYVLGGYSMGGVVALHMAHCLVQTGDEVALVVLLDSDLRTPDMAVVRARAIEFVSRALGVSDPPVSTPYESRHEGATELCERVRELHEGRVRLSPADVLRFAEIYVANATTMFEYTPPQYDGYTTLFYTAEGANSHVSRGDNPAAVAKRLGWTNVIDQNKLATVQLPGDHWTMFTDHVEVLADALREQVLGAYDRSLFRRSGGNPRSSASSVTPTSVRS